MRLHMSPTLSLLLCLLPLVIAEPKMPKGYKTRLFYDDFTSSSLDTSAWKLNKGTSYPGGAPSWGTGETQTYTDDESNVYLSNSTLSIVPLHSDSDWTSARIETTSDHDFKCPDDGKLLVEGKLRLGDAERDSQLGIWPAFWLLGSDYRGDYKNWPEVGEIDIMESSNGEGRAWGTVHCGDVQGGPCEEPMGLGGEYPFKRGEWNTLGLEIDRSSKPQRITWFVNDSKSFQISENDVGDRKAWKSLCAGPKMVLLNVAVGGAFPDGIAQKSTPGEKTKEGERAGMEVDYVAVYRT